MSEMKDMVAGINVDVDDLVRVRSQLSGINLRNIKRRTSFRSGAREARIRGRGMEYEESRAYVFGDDVRKVLRSFWCRGSLCHDHSSFTRGSRNAYVRSTNKLNRIRNPA